MSEKTNATAPDEVRSAHRKWLTQKEAAEAARCTDRTIRAWIAEGRLEAYRVGGRGIRIRRKDLDNLFIRVPADGSGR